jgi:3-oxoacyl-[acyl-carrier-protein] synthase-1
MNEGVSMRTLWIEAVGAFGGAGTSALRAFGAMRLGLKLFEELPSLDAGGQPLIGARTPIDLGKFGGVARLVSMAVAALRECAGPDAYRPAPLLLCLPEPVDGAFVPEGVLSLIAHESSVAVERPLSRVFPAGRLGAIAALQEAERLLSTRTADMLYVGGVDSLVDREPLDRALRAGRIKTSTTEGEIPGEGAAFVKLGPDPRRAIAALTGLATAVEPAPRGADAANSAEGLTSAARAALAEAGLDAAQVGAVFHDAAGDRFAFREAATAMLRLGPRAEPAPRVWATAASAGDVGAAYVPYAVGAAATFLQRGVFTGPGALVLGAGAGAARAAVVVTPPAAAPQPRSRR